MLAIILLTSALYLAAMIHIGTIFLTDPISAQWGLRGGKHMPSSIVRLLSGTLLALALCGGAFASGAERPRQDAMTWQVKVGGESADKALQAQAFLPTSLTINAGDTVVWNLNGFLHTVSFLSGSPPPKSIVPDGNDLISNPVVDNPAGGATYEGTGYANSGYMPVVATSYMLTFPKAGTYSYVCLFHPGMAGSVVVQATGSAYPMTQEQIDAQANVELHAKLSQAQRQAEGVQVATRPAANGATSYTVANGVGGNQSSVIRFLPVELKIKAGDSVTWTVDDPHEIHMVTFYDPAGPLPPIVEEVPQPDGPPKILIRNSKPSGGTSVESVGLYNSGIKEPGQSYTFSFPKPGVYTYVCLIHSEQNMFGKVIVEGLAQPAILPKTGAGAWSATRWPLIAAAILLVTLGLLVRRSWPKLGDS